jgi:hypothetical protein
MRRRARVIVNGIKKSSSDQNSNGLSVKVKPPLSRDFIEKCEDGQILYRVYRVAPRPDWQPPERVTKAEVPHQMAMSKLEKLAEETRANNPKLTTAQASARFSRRRKDWSFDRTKTSDWELRSRDCVAGAACKPPNVRFRTIADKAEFGSLRFVRF